MKKIYNLPGLVKRCFLLTLLASVMTISYGQTVYQKSYDETQGSSVATPSLTENMSLKHGFKLIFDVGYQYQLESFIADVNRIKFNVVGNYQFNPYISAGVGIGMRYYSEINSDLFIFPMFYDMRVRLLDKPFSPYFSIGAGYSVATKGGPTGLYLNPELGVSYRINDKVNIHLTLGYEMQNKVYHELYDNVLVTHSTIHNLGAFSTTFGITF